MKTLVVLVIFLWISAMFYENTRNLLVNCLDKFGTLGQVIPPRSDELRENTSDM